MNTNQRIEQTLNQLEKINVNVSPDFTERVLQQLAQRNIVFLLTQKDVFRLKRYAASLAILMAINLFGGWYLSSLDDQNTKNLDERTEILTEEFFLTQ